MNHALAAADQRGDPLRDDRRVAAGRILPRPEDVEVAQPHIFQSVVLEKLARVDLVHELRRPIRTQRPADLRFDFRRARIVAIDRAAARVNHPPHPVVPRRSEQIERAGDVRLVAAERILDGERHGDETRVMQDVVHPIARLAARAMSATEPSRKLKRAHCSGLTPAWTSARFFGEPVEMLSSPTTR